MSNALNSGSKSGEKETEAPLVQNINETTVTVNAVTTLESTTFGSENNTLSTTFETTELLNHTETTTIAQSTQKPPEPNRAPSKIQLSIYACAFLSLLIKIVF